MSIRCAIGIHQWSTYGEVIKAYSGLTQFRSCKRCKAVGWRGFYGNQASPCSINESVQKIKLFESLK
jgi:hypothetical protein